MKTRNVKKWIPVLCGICIFFSIVSISFSLDVELIEDKEDVGARGFTSRVFNRTYSIPLLDDQENFTGEYRYETRKLVEKSDGLCYDSSLNQEGTTPDPACLEPTNSNFTTDPSGGWKIETGPARVKIAPYSNAATLVSYNVPFRVQNESGEDEKRTFSNPPQI